MPEPSLSEILNVNADPERGTGEPAVVFDDRQFIQGIQRQAEFHAQNDMNKYIQLLQNKKDFYKQGADIAKEQVDPNDKVGLQKRMADVFNKIAQDPKALFGGADMDNLQAQLAGISADATKSKQKYDFNKSMTDHIITSPTFNTDENRAVIKQSEQTPLDEWQPYTLQADPTLDLSKYYKNILGDPKDPNNGIYSKTSANKFTPDNEFYYPETTESVKIDPILKRTDASLLVPQIKRAFEGYYKNLPPEVKAKYEADGGGGLKQFARDFNIGHLGIDKDVTRVSQGKMMPNPFALEQKREATKAAELKLKYNLEGDLAKSKGDMVLDAIKLRALYKNGGKTVKGADGKDKIVPKNEFFDDMFDIIRSDAMKPENAVYEADGSGQSHLVGYVVPTTDKTKLAFGVPKTSKDGKDTPANEVLLSPDGKSMVSVYGGSYDRNAKQIKPIVSDKPPTKTAITVNEGKALLYKNYGTMKDVGDVVGGVDNEETETAPDNEKSEIQVNKPQTQSKPKKAGVMSDAEYEAWKKSKGL